MVRGVVRRAKSGGKNKRFIIHRIMSRTNSTVTAGRGTGKSETVSGVLCDKRIRFRPNGKLHGGAIDDAIGR